MSEEDTLTNRTQDAETNSFIGKDDQNETQLTPQQEFDLRKEKIQKFLKWLKIKAEGAFWVVLSGALIYYSNFFKVLYSHNKVNEIFFGLFMMSIGVNCMVALYATVILPYILGIKEDFDKYSPKVLYIGTTSGVLSFFSLIICIWPVFGYWSPCMVFIFLLGQINIAHFVPNNHFGSLLYGLIFLGVFFSHLIIEHQGMLHDIDGESE